MQDQHRHEDARGWGGRVTGGGAVCDEASHRAAWRRALQASLNREEHVLVMLWYAEGCGPEEIAEVLESTPARVIARHDEIVARLRGIMAAA